MKFSINEGEKHTIFSLEEDSLNTLIAPDVKSEFVILKNKGVVNFILDLLAVKFVDSSGLSAILTANRLWANEGTFILIGISENENVKKLLEISRVNTVLTIIPTRQEAIDYIMMEEIERELNKETDS